MQFNKGMLGYRAGWGGGSSDVIMLKMPWLIVGFMDGGMVGGSDAAFHLARKQEVGAGNDASPEPSTFHHKSETPLCCIT